MISGGAASIDPHTVSGCQSQQRSQKKPSRPSDHVIGISKTVNAAEGWGGTQANNLPTQFHTVLLLITNGKVVARIPTIQGRSWCRKPVVVGRFVVGTADISKTP